MQQEAIEVGMLLPTNPCVDVTNNRVAQEAMDKYSIEKVRGDRATKEEQR